MQRRALVTGGCRGIGEAIAKRLEQEGILVYTCCRCHKNSYTHRQVDFNDSVEDVWKKLLDVAPIDILVNNAGKALADFCEDITVKDWEQLHRINSEVPYFITQLFLSDLKASSAGRVINIASVSGLEGYSTHAHYCAAKHSLIGWSRVLAKELGKHQITVNVIAPGITETSMSDFLKERYKILNKWTEKEARKYCLSRIPLKRFGLPEDVAEVVASLSKPEAGYITGTIIPVCGGQVMSR